MEDSEPFNIEPLFANIEDKIINDLCLSINHLRHLLDEEKKNSRRLLSENYRLKNEVKIVAKRLRKQKI